MCAMGRKWFFILIFILSGIFSVYGKKPDNPPKYLIHVVKPGETLSSISRLYSVTVTDILNVNPSLGEINHLVPEQILRIPNKLKKRQTISTEPTTNVLKPKGIDKPAESVEPKQHAKVLIHTVVKGQTLYSISKMYNVTVQDIQK